MPFQTYDLATLLEVRRQTQGIKPFWSGIATRQINFETPFIDFEVVSRKYRKLAPFVAPTAQGRVLKTQGSNLKRFAPAYVKPKSVIDPSKVIQRQVGETLYSPLSNAQRRDAVIVQEMQEHRTRIENREEWLAAQALIYGKVTISGEDYPTQVVSFGRDASLEATLAGGALWSAGTATPLADIRLMRQRANRLSGAVITDIIFGMDAWDAFAARMQFNSPTTGNLLDTNFRGSTTDVSRIADGFEGIEYMGSVAGRDGQGRIQCYVYSGFYEDDAGNNVDFMSPKDVVGIGPVDLVRCYGAIMDAEAGYQALSVFMKNWLNPDPSVEYLLSQSAPLMVPAEPNATFRMRVLS